MSRGCGGEGGGRGEGGVLGGPAHGGATGFGHLQQRGQLALLGHLASHVGILGGLEAGTGCDVHVHHETCFGGCTYHVHVILS